MERPENPEDLRAICAAKRQAATSAIGATEKNLASLIAQSAAKQDVREIIWTRKSLGQLCAYQGELTRAIEQFSAAYRNALRYAPHLADLLAAQSYLAAHLGVTGP